MKNPKVVAVIQARMNSTRLPGKVLLPLTPNRSVLWWMITRASLAERVDEVVIATTTHPSNDPIEDFSTQCECELPHKLYRYDGDEEDVIGRVAAAAMKFGADIIVDITADCPMVDPNHIDRMTQILIENEELDYISNCIERSWPDGLDVQVYKIDTLRYCIKRFQPDQHAGWNIPQHQEVFNCLHWPPLKEMFWPELGLTLDTPEDYETLKGIHEAIYLGDFPDFEIEPIIDILRRNPQLIKNNSIVRKQPEEG